MKPASSPAPSLPDFPLSTDELLPGSTVEAGFALSVGMDLVEIGRMRESLAKFGDRFVMRIFTAHEAAYGAQTPALQAEKLAARFAAKEAALKALGMADKGVAWKDTEVFRHPDGRCDLRLHGKAAEHARTHGVVKLALSLTHDGNYAAAIVVAVSRKAGQPPTALSDEQTELT